MRNRILNKRRHIQKIHRRVRKKISGTSSKPRLMVVRSLNHLYAQLINDDEGRVIASASSLESDGKSLNKRDKAKYVGEKIAQRVLEKGCKAVVFDRGGHPFHGHIKSVADTARESGLKF